MADFHVGQQVVCVFPGPWKRWPEDAIVRPWPHLNAVYTISEIIECPFRADVVGLGLAEIPGPQRYTSDAFRPVRKTDIGVFEKLLLTKNVREPETV